MNSWKLGKQCHKCFLGKWHRDASGRRCDLLLLSVECCVSHRVRAHHAARFRGQCSRYTRYSLQVSIMVRLHWTKAKAKKIKETSEKNHRNFRFRDHYHSVWMAPNFFVLKKILNWPKEVHSWKVTFCWASGTWKYVENCLADLLHNRVFPKCNMIIKQYYEKNSCCIQICHLLCKKPALYLSTRKAQVTERI